MEHGPYTLKREEPINGEFIACISQPYRYG